MSTGRGLFLIDLWDVLYFSCYFLIVYVLEIRNKKGKIVLFFFVALGVCGNWDKFWRNLRNLVRGH